jgi:hypothetical protein
MADAPIAGFPATIVARRHSVTRGWVLPPVVLHWRSGESSYTNVHLGLFLCRDINLCLPTGAGPQFPPQQ